MNVVVLFNHYFGSYETYDQMIKTIFFSYCLSIADNFEIVGCIMHKGYKLCC